MSPLTTHATPLHHLLSIHRHTSSVSVKPKPPRIPVPFHRLLALINLNLDSRPSVLLTVSLTVTTFHRIPQKPCLTSIKKRVLLSPPHPHTMSSTNEDSKPTPDPKPPTEEPSPAVPDAADDLATDLSGIDPGDETARIDVIQADPTTPYHSASTFEELPLSDDLMRGIYAMKFAKPSKIQATSLPLVLPASGERKNLIAQAHNGSGKTACFVLAMLSQIDFSKEEVQAMCLVPTRELARQIETIILSLGKYTKVRVKVAIKATENEKRISRIEESSTITHHIVVGTPGKVIELLKKRLLVVTTVKMLVLDEADEMVDSQGMGDQTIRVNKMLPPSLQVLLFSATYKEDVVRFANALAPDANRIIVKRETLSLDKIKQYYIHTGSSDQRFNILTDIYDLLNLGQTIIFVRTRTTASDLTRKLRAQGHTVSVLYGGDMLPEERDKVIDEFRHGTTKVLVTTNVLSRGVDIAAVSTVINYDLPTDRFNLVDPETYLHRIGRTGRFGRKGIAINFVYDDTSSAILKQLEKYYSKTIEQVEDVEALSERIQSL